MIEQVNLLLHTTLGNLLHIETQCQHRKNNPKNAQQPYPYIANARQPSNAQQPYPYIAHSREPLIYNHRSPFTYRNPVNGQQPYIANARNLVHIRILTYTTITIDHHLHINNHTR